MSEIDGAFHLWRAAAVKTTETQGRLIECVSVHQSSPGKHFDTIYIYIYI